MKKSYNKPYLGVESFQLNAAVANTCTGGNARSAPRGIAINHWESTCSFPEGPNKPGQFFSLVNCQIDLTDGSVDGNDTLCYHGPMLSNGIIFTFS